MNLLIVIFSLTNGFFYAIEPNDQEHCAKEAFKTLERFRADNPSVNYSGGCFQGGIFLNIKKDDA
jgi:hypothetical protein